MEEEPRPGPLMPLAWMGAAAAVTLLCLLGVGLAAYSSESAGVTASSWATFPLCFTLSGMVAGFGVHFAVRRGPARALVPMGCGCVGGLLGLFGVGFFFAAIFPSL